ncbi:1-deoxy-D-xylulose-5-phosphate synthase [Amycolatopsis magusensis]|uniref:1-deoxy-D-xylulose-5-phosphate synthase n=4 Tax=Amycolatopsis magusensis TaxID=882444 RepID=A0ABS4PT46_9PSEU|nr:1-deoxy-D-xylulose-5-phosphate synthase [Amycolatopsis magusensis]MBP2182594.1 1-deoxy-D-xylulose-5-phosphate synthase [Amycolatopsis magusensis]
MSAPIRPAHLDLESLLEDPTPAASLRCAQPAELRALAGELREFLVEAVCRAGGHLGSNLGVVELTIALHRVFDSPRESLIFDTGHQSYVHKLLTGRGRDFDALREAGGLSGYPSRTESEHDVAENSHASTALSYADGLARAGRPVVAVVGDGALTGGLCWEALNNLATSDRPVVIVLNDNGRSYDPTVGAVGRHLADLRDTAGTGPNLFRALGFPYLGPIDGHDLTAVEEALRAAKEFTRPVVVHCVTGKGRGYRPAELDLADHLHAVSRPGPAGSGAQWTTVFGERLLELAAERPRVVALTAAMLRPTGLLPLAEAFPERVIDVGIAEQHAVAAAAGLALGGLHPVVAVYSTFLTRAMDQVLMDVGLHRLPVTFVLDRAGVTGEDGASHHGMWDIALLRTVPGLRIAAPRDAGTLGSLLRQAVADDEGPTVLRFPKGSAPADLTAVDSRGDVDVLRFGKRPDVLLVTAGPLAATGLRAAVALEHRGIGVTVCDPRWVHPVDPAVAELAAKHQLVVTAEDGVRGGGFGTGLAQLVADAGVPVPVHPLGLPSRFLAHGSRAAILREHGLDATGLTASIQHLWTTAELGGEL